MTFAVHTIVEIFTVIHKLYKKTYYIRFEWLGRLRYIKHMLVIYVFTTHKII